MPQMARRAFLTSDVIGIGIDLFFGGGSYDFAQQAAAGRLVDSGFITVDIPTFSATARHKSRRSSAASRFGTRVARGSARCSRRSASATATTR